MLTQTDARNVVTSSSYDKLGRPLTRNASIDVTGDGVADAIADSWSYDPLYAVGAPATSQRLVNGAIERKQVFTYDTLARPVQTDTTQQIATGSTKAYTQTIAYDSYYGRPKSLGYPNGEAVATYYSKYGIPIRSFNPADNSVYREVTAVDLAGNPTNALLGGGILAETRSYRIPTSELLSISYNKSGAAVRRLDYQTDVFGNLRQQSLNSGATVENYAYDTLQRMTQATRTGAVNASISYAYDAAGNFTSKSDFSTTAANAYTYTGGSCGGGANAVKSVAIASGGSRSYCYDADGNLTSDSAGLAVKYDHDNLAFQTTRGSYTINLAYGPDNQRTREWGSDGTKVYLDGGYEDWISQGSSKVYVGTEAEISNNGGTRTVNYLLTDRLGSVDSIADSTGTLVETRGSDAFGKPRSGTWADLSPAQLQSTAITARGFTEHEHLNSVQLIHMNGRVYDYQLGRFLGVDPFIQFPLNSQSLNPYSYILNNPLAGTDPTGYVAQPTDSGATCGHEGDSQPCMTPTPLSDGSDEHKHDQGTGSRIAGMSDPWVKSNINGAEGQGTGEGNRNQIPSQYAPKYRDMGETKASQADRQATDDSTLWTAGNDTATTYPLGSAPPAEQLQLGELENQFAMTTSPAGLELIKGWEGWNGTYDKKLNKWLPKDDGYGNLTIGWGHNCGKCEDFKNGITKEEGDALLKTDVTKFDKAVNTLRTPMHQQEHDGLVDFAFNVRSYTGSTLFKNVASGTPVTQENFTAYGHAHKRGKLIEVPSLMARRRSEYDAYANGTYDSSH